MKNKAFGKRSITRTRDLRDKLEPERERSRFNLAVLDYVLAPLSALVMSIWAFPKVGYVSHWDDVLYLNLSQYTTPKPSNLNRYGHIYLQKFFLWLAGDTLTGNKLFWCFLFFSTTVLVYCCARKIGGRRGYTAGIAAVIFFWIWPMLSDAGSTLADVTVMFFTALAIFVYLFFIPCRQKYRLWVIMTLGLIFFWAVKSKETGVCIFVLFWILGRSQADTWNRIQFVKDSCYICLGMLAGSVILMTLDQIFLGDALFSVRPSSFKGLFGFVGMEYPKDNSSWFRVLSWSPVMASFLLYLLVGNNLSKREKIAWLNPLAILFFLIFISIRAQSNSAMRHFYPAAPCICICAGQFFGFRLSEMSIKRHSVDFSEKARLKTLQIFQILLITFLLLSLSFFIVWLTMNYLFDSVKHTGWRSTYQLYHNALWPLATTGLLIYAGIFKKRGILAFFVFSFCLLLIFYLPFKNNLNLLNKKVLLLKTEQRFAPYSAFENELTFGHNVKVLVSDNIYKNYKMLGRRTSAHCWMFNIFYNQKFDYDQFIEGTMDNILRGEYTYAFLTLKDWNEIAQKNKTEHISRKYVVKIDRATLTALLKKR